MNKKWYLQTWFICAMAALWPLYGVPLVIAIVLIFIQHNSTKELEKAFSEIEGVDKYAEVKKTEAEELIQKARSEANDIITHANAKAQNIINEKQLELSRMDEEISKKSQYLKDVEDIKTEYEKINKQIDSQHKKLSKIKTIYKSMEHSINCYYDDFVSVEHLKLPKQDIDFAEELAPTVTLKLHSMDIKGLRKAYNDNGKLITDTLAKYESRYTTKANAAIYKLMVIALKAELQNILYNLKYDKLDKSIGYIKETTQKYLTVASDGNQSIAGTMVKFIGEIEFLFINALKIEYEYYVKKYDDCKVALYFLCRLLDIFLEEIRYTAGFAVDADDDVDAIALGEVVHFGEHAFEGVERVAYDFEETVDIDIFQIEILRGETAKKTIKHLWAVDVEAGSVNKADVPFEAEHILPVVRYKHDGALRRLGGFICHVQNLFGFARAFLSENYLYQVKPLPALIW